MSRFIPQPAYPDAMPVDISFVFADEKPAGKHGFCKADGDDLRFEDGTLARFWGVNFNGGACFPEHDYSPKVARRLAQAGCNIVRFHQLDAEFDTPNIYAYTKGKRVDSTRAFDPTSMDRLDYLIYCLKEEGIYCYLDMCTYRHYKEKDEVVGYELLRDNARPWSIIDPHLIELQKEQATAFWTHYNPYTKLKYADDPVFVLTEITNECDIFNDSNKDKADTRAIPYYENEFRMFFKEWLEENGKEYDWEHCDLYTFDPELIDFKIYIQDKFFCEMHKAMRDAGCKIPITGTNWTKSMGNVNSHKNMDFTDSHHYFYDWHWGNTERVCKHKAISEAPYVFPNLARMKIANKPFFCSEWDVPWPNSYRAEGPIYYAALGALQGWSGFTIHTYSYGTRLSTHDILGKEQSSPVGGVPYREGIFSTWNDPAKFGLFYHSALMLRRGDISPADKKIAVNSSVYSKMTCKSFQTGLEKHFLANVFDNKLPEGYDELIDEQDVIPSEEKGILASDNGQWVRDIPKKLGMVKSERTKIAFGSLSRGGAAASTKIVAASPIDLGDVVINANTDFGVIALSSLTDDPITSSKNILISAIGRARNTGAQFDGDKMIDRGTSPITAEVIQATISIKTDIGDKLKVWGVNAEGFYAGCMASNYEDGVFTFTIGDEFNPACYYLVVAE